jgi:hypothetical protein
MESISGSEFLLGIEEYLRSLGFEDQSTKIHALANSLNSDSSREKTTKVFLQNISADIGDTNRPLADMIHKFLTSKEENDFYSSTLMYILNQEIEQNLKDYIFKIVKSCKNKEDILVYTLKFIMTQDELTIDLKDHIHNITKLKSVNDRFLLLLKFVFSLKNVDQNIKNFIFKLIKPKEDKLTTLLLYLGRVLDKKSSNLSYALAKASDKDNFEHIFIKNHISGLAVEFANDKFFRSINSCLKNNLLPQEVINDAFSRSQIKSKFWLMSELSNIKKGYGNVLIMAGWFGQTKSIYDKFLTYKKMRIIDLDKNNCNLSDYVFNLGNLEEHKVKSICANINNLELHKNGYEWTVENFKEPEKNYKEKFLPDLIINTSAEHMTEEWFNQIRFKQLDSDPIVAIQSNNMFGLDDHINCVHSIDHMKKKFPMREVLYEGELQLKGYKRVMLIGRP